MVRTGYLAETRGGIINTCPDIKTSSEHPRVRRLAAGRCKVAVHIKQIQRGNGAEGSVY